MIILLRLESGFQRQRAGIVHHCFWESTAPSPSLEASVSNRKGLSKSGNTRTGADWTFPFKTVMASRASGAGPPDPSSLLSLARHLRGALGWQIP